MNPLFYTDITLVSRENDRERRVLRGIDRMGFCARSHLCPALAAEFVAAAGEFPIVFLRDGGRPTPVFLFGLEPGENLFVSPDHAWTGRHLPRYLDRYPFMLIELDGGTRALGLAAEAGSESDGEALFEAGGEPSALTTRALAVCESYARDAVLSDAFVDRIVALDLLRDISIEVTKGETRKGWSDLAIVDEARLATLGDEDLLRLARSGDLALIHAHLLSIRTFERLRDRL